MHEGGHVRYFKLKKTVTNIPSAHWTSLHFLEDSFKPRDG